MNKKDLKMYVTPVTEVVDLDAEDYVMATSFEQGERAREIGTIGEIELEDE